MTDTISELVQLLSQDVGVAEIAARVGPVIKDEPSPEGLDLQPKLNGVRAARLSRYQSGEPFALTLKLTTRPTVAAMKKQFGGFTEDVDFDHPVSLSFRPAAGERWKVVVIADLDTRGGTVRDDDKVVRVALRRDRVKP